MATDIMRKGVSGAMIGAGIGLGASILMALVHRSAGEDPQRKKQSEPKYRNILDDGELNTIVDDFDMFREVSPNAYEKFLQSADKFAGICQIILSFPGEQNRKGETFDPGWSITAHHHSESMRESLSAIEFSISDSMKEKFTELKKQIVEYIDNSLYNINMHTQTIVSS